MAVKIGVELGQLFSDHTLPGDLLVRPHAMFFDALQLSVVNRNGM